MLVSINKDFFVQFLIDMPKETLKENHNAIDITLHAPHPPKMGRKQESSLALQRSLNLPILCHNPNPS